MSRYFTHRAPCGDVIEAATRFGIIISICGAAGVVIAQGIRWAVM